MKYIETKYEFGVSDPGLPKEGEIQVFYEGDKPLMVDFRCPCGCGHTCPTHLKEEGEKKLNDRHWVFSRGPNGGVTLTPSIRWTGGCLAHFNITDGEAIIHPDSGKKV